MHLFRHPHRKHWMSTTAASFVYGCIRLRLSMGYMCIRVYYYSIGVKFYGFKYTHNNTQYHNRKFISCFLFIKGEWQNIVSTVSYV